MMKGKERQSYTIEHFNANDSTTSQNNQNHLRHLRVGCWTVSMIIVSIETDIIISISIRRHFRVSAGEYFLRSYKPAELVGC